jgi:integrase
VHLDDLAEQQGARVLQGWQAAHRRAARRRGVDPDRVVGRERRGTRPVALHQVRRRAGRPAAHREIRSLAASVGIDVLHPHTLRHTFATSGVDSGAEVLRLATALGHDSPTTTMRYVRGRDVVTGSPVHAGGRRDPGIGGAA